MKVLFCCTGNLMRSVTAHALLEQRGFGHQVRSAGTHAEAVGGGGTQLIVEHIEWADTIFVFEPMHVEFITTRFGSIGRKARRKLINLMIEDRYPAFDAELIQILNRHIDSHFGRHGSRRPEPIRS